MEFQLKMTPEASQDLADLKASSNQAAFKAVAKALRLMAADIRHKSLKTHEYQSLEGPNGEKVFEAYAQNDTPGARRIFWCYGPEKGQITILAILKHPD